MEKPKICLIASSGGHLFEISRLNKIINDYDSFIITEDVPNLDLSNYKMNIDNLNNRLWYVLKPKKDNNEKK